MTCSSVLGVLQRQLVFISFAFLLYMQLQQIRAAVIVEVWRSSSWRTLQMLGVFGEARRCHEAGEGAGYTKDEFAKRTLSKYVRSFGTGCPLVVRVVQTTGGAVLLGRSIALFVGRIENHTCPLSWMATW